jgi:hypothetical protein
MPAKAKSGRQQEDLGPLDAWALRYILHDESES